MIVDMFEYYNMINDMGVDIIYSGPLWANGIEGIAGTLRKRLEFDELTLTASQSVFSVFVEQMNNMLMYSTEKECFNLAGGRYANAPRGVFILGAKDGMYFLQSGNLIKNEAVESMKNRIEYLNTLDKAALRKYYKEQIKKENTNPDSKGAGLGLIEIARRASTPIEYSFIPVNNGLTFFVMFVEIEQGGTER